MFFTAYLYWGNDERYEAASDVTLTTEFGETLDNASVVIPNIKASSGIAAKAKPYDEVMLEIYKFKGQPDQWRYRARYLIDSIDVAQTSYTGDETYCDVTLQLMSETKYLEKVQLPNKAFTHSLVNGAKTVYEAAKYLVDTYSPKYVGESGLTPLLAMSESADWTRFKATPCADVTMSKPTLRQALTTLFTQVGCIPTVYNRKVSFLDLTKSAGEFLIGGKAPEKVASVRKGMSSDSWVNSIVSESSQCVDYDSSCVIEQLCFRDRDNVLLKQTENLKLETRYPIYEVKKLVLNAYTKGKAKFNSVYLAGGNGIFSGIGGCGTNMVYGDMPGCVNVSFTTSGTKPAIKISPWCQSTTDVISASGYLTFSFILARVNDDGSLTAVKTISSSTFSFSWENAKQSDPSTYKAVVAPFGFDVSDYTGSELTLATFTFTGTITVNGHTWTASKTNPNFGFATDSHPKTNVTWNVYPSYFSAYEFTTGTWDGKINPFIFFKDASSDMGFRSSMDITPLCVESSKRAQLEVDFQQMPEWGGVDEMSKYLYATVGYSIGGTSIEGFSTKYEYSKGFWNESYTYIENIINSMGITRAGVNDYYAGAIPQKYWAYMFEAQKIANPLFSDEAHNTFSLLSFDVEYVPLIQSKASWEKADVPLLLEQLDSAESGVSSMDAVAASEGEKADRLGNAAWSIHARVTDPSDLAAVNSQWDGRVAFKVTLKFGANAIDAEYALAENYVLKNYFTSIVTKYRAYEYVDYSQSVERRELMRAYIRVSNAGGGNSLNAFGGESGPRIWAEFNFARKMMGALEGYCDSSNRLVGAGYKTSSYWTECELSAVCAGNSVVFTMKEYDNASDGPYVDGTYLTKGGTWASDPIGGIPQKWYPSRGSEVPEIVLYTENETLKGMNWGSDADAFVGEAVRLSQQYPRFPRNKYPFAYDDWFTLKFPFSEKDAAELMSYSLQVSACWASSRAKFESKEQARFSKWLFRFSPLLGGYPSKAASLVAFASSDTGMTWTGAKRKLAATDQPTALEYFWEYAAVEEYSMDVNPLVGGLNSLSAIEVCILDRSDVYPLAWFQKSTFMSKVTPSMRVTIGLHPIKSDKTLKESASHSLLYES